MCAVGQACPTSPSLEMETFHKCEFYRSGGMTADEASVMGDDFTVAIVVGVGVSEMEEF